MTEHLIQGERITMPVEIRDASACTAVFAVRAGVVRSVLGHAGVVPAEPVPGRALCSLVFVRYLDGDLGPYHEFGVVFLIRSPAGRGLGAFVHWLPVNQSFTLEAGRSIWGFPKEMADIELGFSGGTGRCAVHLEGERVLELLIRPGVPVPARGAGTSIDAYTYADGVLRRTPWRLHGAGVRARPGGAVLRLGAHPVAAELRRMGLPGRALFSSGIARMRMSFGDAEVL
ncbi:acetoacetate decarboxylase family protein [Sciscionella sediminilitoris]|uniref:acetoacetate decarboxylase family protein n=1 Tax=Sciscionella sediminilitoris TaxID=1445613 RepID=UPI0004DEDA23|nr:acetoacetate decarboxylase family protein [Sciscionella sp. SE31]